MNFIKSLMLAGMFLITLTAGNCFVVSNFDSSDDDDDDEDRNSGGLTIGITNGIIISKDAMQSLTQTLAIADIASQSMKYTSNAMVPEPVHYSCNNSNGEIISTTYDLDTSYNVSSGDEIVLSYVNCKNNNELVNGDVTISVLRAEGASNCNFSTGIDWHLSIRTKISYLKITSEKGTYEVKGKMDVSLEYLAATTLLQATISNNNLIINDDTKTYLSDINITQLLNLAVVPSNYSLFIDSFKLFNEELNGFVDVKVEKLYGIEQQSNDECFISLYSPESGVIRIMGKDSNADIHFMPGNQSYLELDSNGDSISDEVINSSIYDAS